MKKIMTKVDLNAVFNRMADTRRGVITRPKNFHIFSIPLLKSEDARCIVKNRSFKTLHTAEAATVNGGDFQSFIISRPDCIFGLGEGCTGDGTAHDCVRVLNLSEPFFCAVVKSGAEKLQFNLTHRRTA